MLLYSNGKSRPCGSEGGGLIWKQMCKYIVWGYVTKKIIKDFLITDVANCIWKINWIKDKNVVYCTFPLNHCGNHLLWLHEGQNHSPSGSVARPIHDMWNHWIWQSGLSQPINWLPSMYCWQLHQGPSSSQSDADDAIVGSWVLDCVDHLAISSGRTPFL